MSFLTVVFFYFILKYAAYTTWCYRGLQKFRRLEVVSPYAAYRFGFYRLLIGLFFGVIIGIVVLSLRPEFSQGIGGGNFLYLCIYVPVRWIEWMILSILIIPGTNAMRSWLLGLNQADRVWRLGGIGVSFLADLPIIIAASALPVGRFLC